MPAQLSDAELIARTVATDDSRAFEQLVHEYSHSEIALVTGLPLGTVKSKLNRAKGRILARLNATEQQHV